MREELFVNTLPNMLKYTKENLIMGGDWNCIIDPHDCTDYADQKFSPTLKRMLKMFKMRDTFRVLEPSKTQFS